MLWTFIFYNIWVLDYETALYSITLWSRPLCSGGWTNCPTRHLIFCWLDLMLKSDQKIWYEFDRSLTNIPIELHTKYLSNCHIKYISDPDQFVWSGGAVASSLLYQRLKLLIDAIQLWKLWRKILVLLTKCFLVYEWNFAWSGTLVKIMALATPDRQ
jgi:hypothetical protein